MTSHPHRPKAVFILSYVSIVLSLLTFLFTMMNPRFATVFTVPLLSFLTGVHHTTILNARYRSLRRQTSAIDDEQSHKGPFLSATLSCIVCVCVLALFWVLPLGLLAWDVFELETLSSLWKGNWSLVIQLVFIVVEVLVLVAIATLGTRMRHRAQRRTAFDMSETKIEGFHRTEWTNGVRFYI